ncbi:hypothetical protein CAOG_00141 [Capsaspora owczarzaki ATCC 30864]|uniref:RWD domain-containing protein n=1 Tax=Capsaspora owczarzaki (strain ATCC 30864) TaxID=595528 RepID=A0A0D2TZZ0_CAPO3|nr:hypothetical protein CAOG_00141 [Capsaspora owczarzaki ATCC 30864]KJE88491.1 hypothetical protein CAOG_000141 [Capsaspora owczarzaki ATCC 30864]|eukprot:XP_004365012.1 hypothetical protein CAOG_00141 [Capsaspora owczarzaki ATCC 30864]
MTYEAAQLEEEEALAAIYAEHFRVVTDDAAAKIVRIRVEDDLWLSAVIPTSYPSLSSPLAEIHCDRDHHRHSHQYDRRHRDQRGSQAAVIDRATLEGWMDRLDQLASDSKGQVVLFQWVEYLKEAWSDLHQANAGAGAGQSATDGAAATGLPTDLSEDDDADHAATDAELQEIAMLSMSFSSAESRHASGGLAPRPDSACPVILSGDAYTERKSVFVAHVATVHSEAQVSLVRSELLQNRKIAAATHNIMAYRIHRPATGAFAQDCDDDGEDAAGGRLLQLLQLVDARNVVVVVSRWYGGQLLGPSRFKIINNVARAQLSKCGYIATDLEDADSGKSKKR